MNPATVPCPSKDTAGDGRWLSVHERYVAQAHEMEPDVVLIGDSQLAYLELTELWQSWFAPLHTMSLAKGGDNTENVLWRLLNGELEFIKPKVAVVLVGTNNLANGHTPEQVSEGIITVCSTIRDKLPQTEILLLTLLQRGEKPNPLREKINQVNTTIIQEAKSLTNVQVVPIGTDLVGVDGLISHHDLYDYLHLSVGGYRRVFAPVLSLLQQILGPDDGAILRQINSNSSLSSPTES